MKALVLFLVICSVFIWSNLRILTHENTDVSDVKKSEYIEDNYQFEINGRYFVCNVPKDSDFKKFGEFFRIFINKDDNIILNKDLPEEEKVLFEYINNSQNKWDYVLSFQKLNNDYYYSLDLSMGVLDVERFHVIFKENDGVIEAFRVIQISFNEMSFVDKYWGLFSVIPSIIISLFFFRIHQSLTFYRTNDGFTLRELFYKFLILSLLLLPIWIWLYLWDMGYLYYYSIGHNWYSPMALIVNLWITIFLIIFLLIIYTPFLYISWLIQKKVDGNHQSEFEKGYNHGFKIGFFIGSDTPHMEDYPVPMVGVTIPNYWSEQLLENLEEPSGEYSVCYKKGYFEGYAEGQFRGEIELKNT